MAKSKQQERGGKRHRFKAKLKKFARHACKVTACTLTGAKVGALFGDPVFCTAIGFTLGVRSVLKDGVGGDVVPTVYDIMSS
ncbi:hypothetical protein BAE44_0022033 [Dichanthelium oligosanthes]|uniref:Uncharacterized protein n=1 Tax=Dichanthelium oligosanthes TaxID=888268 RepID=A0A1E5UVU8_9POAL|nr:hypothetical protein BAE44_0022033 [Dichanthelium oligosanthes]